MHHRQLEQAIVRVRMLVNDANLSSFAAPILGPFLGFKI